MSVEQAARKLGVSPQFLRLALQQNKFDFGTAVKTSPNRYTYYINERRLEFYMEGIDYETKYNDCGNSIAHYDTDCV